MKNYEKQADSSLGLTMFFASLFLFLDFLNVFNGKYF